MFCKSKDRCKWYKNILTSIYLYVIMFRSFLYLYLFFMEGAYVIEYIKLEKISCEKKLICEISNIIKKSNTTKTKHNTLITDDLIKTFVTELLSHNLFATYLGKDIAEEKKDIFKRFQELANIWTDRVLFYS